VTVAPAVADQPPSSPPRPAPAPASTPAPAPTASAPAQRVRILLDPPFRRRGVAARAFTGRLTGSAAGLKVRIAISRPWKGSRTRCSWWTPQRGRFGSPTRCDAPALFTARATRTSATTWKWRLDLGGAMRPGNYQVTLRAFDAEGRQMPASTASPR